VDQFVSFSITDFKMKQFTIILWFVSAIFPTFNCFDLLLGPKVSGHCQLHMKTIEHQPQVDLMDFILLANQIYQCTWTVNTVNRTGEWKLDASFWREISQ
jgi:hypothetical protein